MAPHLYRPHAEVEDDRRFLHAAGIAAETDDETERLFQASCLRSVFIGSILGLSAGTMAFITFTLWRIAAFALWRILT